MKTRVHSSIVRACARLEQFEPRRLLAEVAAELSELHDECTQFIEAGGTPATFVCSNGSLVLEEGSVRIEASVLTPDAVPSAITVLRAAGFVENSIAFSSTIIRGFIPIENVDVFESETGIEEIDPELPEVYDDMIPGDRLPDSLWELYSHWQTGGDLTNVPGVWDAYDAETGTVELYGLFRTNDPAIVTAQVESIGGAVGDFEDNGRGFVGIPVSRLPEFVALSDFITADPLYANYALDRVVHRSVVSQGDAAMNANDARSSAGVTGSA